MKLIGSQGWVTSSYTESNIQITDAIIRNEGKEIVIDYEYQNKKEMVRLNSNDGVHFRGKYGETGYCDFTLYKNVDGYFLFGGYSSVEDGDGIWWIELKPQSKGAV